jgi:hypothetical protein
MPRIAGGAVAQVAFRAGFRNYPNNPRLTIAVAIAAGESGWNTTAHNPRYPDDSYGLWQINRLAHPWAVPPGIYSAQTNANAAWRVFTQAGFSFRPWTIYTRGIYRQHMTAAAIAVAAIGIGPGTSTEIEGGGGGPGYLPTPEYDFSPGIGNAASALGAAGRWLYSYAGTVKRIAEA